MSNYSEQLGRQLVKSAGIGSLISRAMPMIKKWALPVAGVSGLGALGLSTAQDITSTPINKMEANFSNTTTGNVLRRVGEFASRNGFRAGLAVDRLADKTMTANGTPWGQRPLPRVAQGLYGAGDDTYYGLKRLDKWLHK